MPICPGAWAGARGVARLLLSKRVKAVARALSEQVLISCLCPVLSMWQCAGVCGVAAAVLRLALRSTALPPPDRGAGVWGANGVGEHVGALCTLAVWGGCRHEH